MEVRKTIGERIVDLRISRNWNQKELAKKIGIAASQLSRIESDKLKTISSDTLIQLSKVFHVSTDYILGLTEISTRKNYDVSELGLSEGAVSKLVSGKINARVLNLLLEHKDFAHLLSLMKVYFDDSLKAGIMTRNEFIDFATDTLMGLANEKPEHQEEVANDIRLLRSQKLGEHEAEMERIKKIFISILKDIKDQLTDGAKPNLPVTHELLSQMLAEVKKEPGKRPTIKDVAAAVIKNMRPILHINDKAEKRYEDIMVEMIEEADEQIK